MIKRIVVFLLALFILTCECAFSAPTYDFSEAKHDAETVHSFFAESGNTDAAAAYDRLYDFWYKDAKDYVLNRNTGKFHDPQCPSVTKQMKETNKVFITCSRDLLTAFGFQPCGNCQP